MPGLIVVSTSQKEMLHPTLEDATDALNQDGGILSGREAFPDACVGVGRTRFAWADDASSVARSEDGRFSLVLSGEVVQQGNVDRDSARVLDSRVSAGELLTQLVRSGPSMLTDCSGEFAGALVDRVEGTVVVFNDPLGMHRLFLHRKGKTVCVSSEIGALTAATSRTPGFSPGGVAEFLATGCTLGRNSLYTGVEVLPEAAWVTLARGSARLTSQYTSADRWDEVGRDLPAPTDDEIIQAFFEATWRACDTTDASSIGVSLTGGLDSRMVLAAAVQGGLVQSAFGFGSSYRETLDVTVGRRVANAVGLGYETIVVGDEFRVRMQDYLERAVRISGGNIGVSGAAELYANEQVAKISRIRLTGNYGSELFRGARAFKYAPVDARIATSELSHHLTVARENFDQLTSEPSIPRFVAYRQAQHQSFGRHAIERSQLAQRSPFLDAHLLEVIHRAGGRFDGFALSRRIIEMGDPRLLTITSDRGYLGTRRALRRRLNRAYREVVFKLEYLLGYGAPSSVVRLDGIVQALGIEQRVLGTNKFYHLRQWYRDSLRPFAREVLTDPSLIRLMPMIEFNGLQEIVRNHFNRTENHTELVDRLLTLALSTRCVLRTR